MSFFQDAKTVVANVADTLINPGYNFQFAVQNHCSDNLWISQSNPPDLAPPSVCVPKAINGVPGFLEMDIDTPGPWYLKSAVAGVIGVFWKPAGS